MYFLVLKTIVQNHRAYKISPLEKFIEFEQFVIFVNLIKKIKCSVNFAARLVFLFLYFFLVHELVNVLLRLLGAWLDRDIFLLNRRWLQSKNCFGHLLESFLNIDRDSSWGLLESYVKFLALMDRNLLNFRPY